MANKKLEIGAKSKAAPAATPLESGQKSKASGNQLPVTTPELAAAEKVEKGKKAQATKKGNKAQQLLAKAALEAQSKAPIETQAIAPSEVKLNDGEAKVQKQVAVEPVVAEPIVTETAPVSKKVTLEQASAKSTKMKRLTLDIAKPLHKAIKAKAVEEGIPMVDMLRSLLEEHYGK